jgi:hypothetical protein
VFFKKIARKKRISGAEMALAIIQNTPDCRMHKYNRFYTITPEAKESAN